MTTDFFEYTSTLNTLHIVQRLKVDIETIL